MQPEVGLPKPDLVIFLQLNPSVAAERGEFGMERYETGTFQSIVQQRFEQLMKDPSVNWKVNCFMWQSRMQYMDMLRWCMLMY